MREFNVSVPDKIGALRDAARALGDAGINIRAISSEIRDSGGVLHIITEKESAARKVLKAAGYEFNEMDIVSVRMNNEPGELAKYATRLAEKGVNVRAVYLLGDGGSTKEVAFSVDDFNTAMRVCYPGERGAY